MTDPLPPRLARPGETFEYADGLGTLHTLTADADGHLQPDSADADQMLEQRGLPRIEAAPDGPSHKALQARARELDLSASGSKAELTAAIAARESELAATSPNDNPDAGDGDGSTPPAGGDSAEAPE